MIKKIDFGVFFVGIIVFLAVMNGFYWLYQYGDNFPHLDEWNFVPVNDNFFKYIFSYNNENLQVFTNFKFFLVEYLGCSWGCVKYISYFIYLLMVFILFNLLKRHVDGYKKSILCMLLLLFFTHYSIEISLWVILSQTWFYFIFMFLAVKYGFNEKSAYQNMWITIFWVLCSILAMNIAFGICFSIVYILKNILNMKDNGEKKKVFLNSMIFIEAMLVFMILFWVNMRKGDETIIYWHKLFSVDFFYWLFYALFAPCFGMLLPKDNVMLVLVVGCVLFFFIGYLFFRQIKDENKQNVWALFLVICGGMSAIVLFRGAHVLELNTFASRYIMYGSCLSLIIYVLCAQDDKKQVRCIGNVLAIIMLLCMGYNFFGNRILVTYKANEISRNCIMRYYNLENRPLIYYCPGKYWGNIAPKLSKFEKVYL